MKIVIFEVCRSPKIEKTTEPVVLSPFFQQKKIAYQLYSNDQRWSAPVTISQELIRSCLAESLFDFVHLAMHGDNYSLILKWSTDRDVRLRVAEDTLSGLEIMKMAEWQDKIIVSGACNSSHLAPFFLKAGAKAVIAPPVPVNWPNLGQFFCLFYEGVIQRQTLETALNIAVAAFPEYACYKIYRKQEL